MLPNCLFVMGVSGCGKSTVGKELAQEIGAEFLDGDDHHSAENLKKMSNGLALTDEDRFPWLEKLAKLAAESPHPVVIACSALKHIYRETLTKNLSGSFVFLYLDVQRCELKRRLKARKNHFFNPCLLDSQIAALELKTDEKNFYYVSGQGSINETVNEAVAILKTL